MADQDKRFAGVFKISNNNFFVMFLYHSSNFEKVRDSKLKQFYFKNGSTTVYRRFTLHNLRYTYLYTASISRTTFSEESLRSVVQFEKRGKTFFPCFISFCLVESKPLKHIEEYSLRRAVGKNNEKTVKAQYTRHS